MKENGGSLPGIGKRKGSTEKNRSPSVSQARYGLAKEILGIEGEKHSRQEGGAGWRKK